MPRLAAVISPFRALLAELSIKKAMQAARGSLCAGREPMSTPAVQLRLAAEFGSLRNEIEEMRRVLNYQRGLLDFLLSQRDTASSPAAHDDAAPGHKVH